MVEQRHLEMNIFNALENGICSYHLLAKEIRKGEHPPLEIVAKAGDELRKKGWRLVYWSLDNIVAAAPIAVKDEVRVIVMNYTGFPGLTQNVIAASLIQDFGDQVK